MVYEGLPQIARLAPGKSWVSVDISSLQQTVGKRVGWARSETIRWRRSTPWPSRGNTVDPIGPSTINGQSVQGYTVILNPAVERQEMERANLSRIDENGRCSEVAPNRSISTEQAIWSG